ncbi:MAG: 4Fe-4S binding protein [Oscillospiraceae bacterium]
MKKLKVKDHAMCHTCLQCVVACSTAFYKEFDPAKSCIALGQKKDGSPMVKVCIQCGKCAKACEAGAITQNAKGVYMINKKLCTKCGKCVEACPFGVIVKPDADSFPSKCIACGICASQCPMDILEIVEA